MSNVNHPHGFRPLMRTLTGGFPSTNEYLKAVTLATAVFMWDVVQRVADGSIDVAGNGTPGTTNWTGVALNWGAALKATAHIVIDSPFAVFEAQDNDAVTGTLITDMGANANIVATAGDAVLKLSKHQIDQSTIAVTSTLDLHLLRKYTLPLGDAFESNDYGPNARIEVVFNKHRMGLATAGV
jgi:hypothetical protein